MQNEKKKTLLQVLSLTFFTKLQIFVEIFRVGYCFHSTIQSRAAYFNVTRGHKDMNGRCGSKSIH